MSPRTPLFALLALAYSCTAGAAQWTAAFGHVGPLRIGMSLAAANRVLDEHLTAHKVPGADPTGRCFYADPVHAPAIQLMIVDGRVARIDVVAPGIATARGVSVGNSQAAVLAAYGAKIKLQPNFYAPHRGQYLTARAPGGRYGIRFEAVDGKVTAYYIGTPQTIRYVEGCA